MPTLANGASVTLVLTDNDSVTISTQGLAIVTAVSGLGVAVGKIGEYASTQTLGPYTAGSLTIVASVSDCQYEVGNGVRTGSPSVSYDSTGNPAVLLGPAGRSVVSLNTPVKLKRFRAAVAKALAGVSNAKVIFLGDSTTAGAGGSGVPKIGCKPYSFPTVIGQYLAAAGLPISSASYFADNNMQAAYWPEYDPRITAEAGWDPNSTTGVSGCLLQCTTIGAKLTFAPTEQFDTIDVYYYKNSTRGDMTVSIDGGASLGTLAGYSATAVMAKASFTVALGVHTVVVTGATANPVLVGVDCYNNTAKQVRLWNWGAYGWTTVQWALTAGVTTPYLPIGSISGTYQPDLTIINLTINDSNALTALDTYRANIRALIAECLITGDVVLMTGVPSNTVQATNGTLDTYIQVLYDLAAEFNLLVIDYKRRWESYTVSNPFGYYYDSNHPSRAGYIDIARGLKDILAGA